MKHSYRGTRIVIVAIYVGLLLTLVVGVTTGFMAAFSVIDHLASYAANDGGWYTYQSMLNELPVTTALMTVTFLFLLYITRKARIGIAETRDTVWHTVCNGIIMSILIGAVAVLIISIGIAFSHLLKGDLSMALFAKSSFSALTGAVIFFYYRGLVRDGWETRKKATRTIMIATSTTVTLITVTAIGILDPLQRQGLDRTHETLEQLKVAQGDIDRFFKEHGYLPTVLSDPIFLESEEVHGYDRWPEVYANMHFTYRRTGTATYHLCANFEVLPKYTNLPQYPYSEFEIGEEGERCFDREAK